jgi:S1-C subfamily serine protease
MQRMIKSVLLAIALLTPVTGAFAAEWFAWQSDNSLRWRSEGQSLHLITAKDGGVNVVALTPGTLWGLAQGDVIQEADGKPLHDVAGLMKALRAHGDSPLPLKLRRNGAEQVVMLAAQARGGLLHDAPPTPPTPPAPPAPPGG